MIRIMWFTIGAVGGFIAGTKASDVIHEMGVYTEFKKAWDSEELVDSLWEIYQSGKTISEVENYNVETIEDFLKKRANRTNPVEEEERDETEE